MNNIFTAEMVGTAILVLLGDGVVAGVVLAKSKANGSGWIVITTGWGLAVAMAVYAVTQYSGAHLNPAVTLGMLMQPDNGMTGGDVAQYIGGQFVGAFIGAIIVYLMYLPHWGATEDQASKLGVFCTAPAIRNTPANLISEIIGTFMLVFGVLTIFNQLNANGDPAGFATGIGPALVGLLVFSIGLSLGGPTGYAINPARDLGPRIAHFVLPIPGKGGSDWGYAPIPVVGPIIGGIIGGLVFRGLYL